MNQLKRDIQIEEFFANWRIIYFIYKANNNKYMEKLSTAHRKSDGKTLGWNSGTQDTKVGPYDVTMGWEHAVGL